MWKEDPVTLTWSSLQGCNDELRTQNIYLMMFDDVLVHLSYHRCLHNLR